MTKTDTDLVVNPGPRELVPRFDSSVILRNVAELIDMVPEIEDGDELAIVAQIIQAGDLAELDRPWRTTEFDRFFETQIRVTGMRRRASDFAGGLGIYLILDVVDESTGELHTVTTGSTSCVAQLLAAHAMEGLPLVVTPCQAKKPSKNGYYPQHLRDIRRG